MMNDEREILDLRKRRSSGDPRVLFRGPDEETLLYFYLHRYTQSEVLREREL